MNTEAVWMRLVAPCAVHGAVEVAGISAWLCKRVSLLTRSRHGLGTLRLGVGEAPRTRPCQEAPTIMCLPPRGTLFEAPGGPAAGAAMWALGAAGGKNRAKGAKIARRPPQAPRCFHPHAR